MAFQGVLVIHRADQDEFAPLAAHQEKAECGCGWWDMIKESELPPGVPVATLPPDYLCDILCLPGSQLLFKPDEWTDEGWHELLRFILDRYPGHLASVVCCHS